MLQISRADRNACDHRARASEGLAECLSLGNAWLFDLRRKATTKGQYKVSAEKLLVDKAQLLTLIAPEMTVLLGKQRLPSGGVV